MSYEQTKRSLFERRRNILYLISQYLFDVGLHATNSHLIEEAQLCKEYHVCDNIDLDTMYLEFVSYQQIKFGKPPKILKKIESMGDDGQPENTIFKKNSAVKRRSIFKNPSEGSSVSETTNNCSIASKSLTVSQIQGQYNEFANSYACTYKPLHLHDHYTSPEWKEMAENIVRDMIKNSPNVKWEDVCGHDTAKGLLKESVITPLEYPHLFADNNIKPWRGVLIHGPPGTGKTLLARALCSQTKERITFFNISSSSLMSKWRGESEKLVRVLFDLAKFYAPTIIFIDEFEGLSGKRDCLHAEHESTKRFKNEFLTLMDGIESENNSGIFILATTNLPWEIDPAFLRRFERKILIDLPDQYSRMELFRQYLPTGGFWNESKLNELADITEHYTGDDIRIACKEASMILIRRTINPTMKNDASDKHVDLENVKCALKQIKPVSKLLIQKHRDWNKNYGSQL